MPALHGDFRPNRTIARQHIQIEALVDALNNRLDSGCVATRNLVSLFNSLAAHLEFHFELEEEEDYFANILARAPQLAAQVDALLQDHVAILGEVSRLVEEARRAFADQLDTTELASQFVLFRQKLLDHEGAEIALLKEAYTRNRRRRG